MLKRVFIANRGEIAWRIQRACRELGVETVCGYSRIDASQHYLQHANDTVCIGESDYLHINNILMAAKNSGCDAIHPGYGFLAENAEFARQVKKANIKLVGPSVDHIRLMGNKIQARELIKQHELQSVPGSEALKGDLRSTEKMAEQIGFPLMVKAAAGGGGRGIRLVEDKPQFQQVLESTRREALAFFGSDEVYLEKYLQHPRHVEIQVLGDGRGDAVHLGSRDCSIQRKHQKLIEEGPAPFIPVNLLDGLAEHCSALCRSIKYEGAGTLEFLYQDKVFYFIEMNTRIQVEHTITEVISGVDLVKAQLMIAGGGSLPFSQKDIEFRGHAIECRINAEDDEFMPSPGVVRDPVFPGGPGIRVDSHLYNGCQVPHQYDSLVAKVIAHGADRQEALVRMQRALAEFSLKGIETNQKFLAKMLNHAAFKQGEFDNRLVER